MENQIAIVTGGGQGICPQIVLRLGQQESFPVITDIREIRD